MRASDHIPFSFVPFVFEQTVYLTSRASGKIVSCTEGEMGPLVADRDKADTWETIVPEHQPDGTVAFRSAISDLYISVEEGTNRLIPSRTEIQEWEKFRAFRCDSEDDTAFILQSCKNGRFVQTHLNCDPPYLVADCVTPDSWEQFCQHRV